MKHVKYISATRTVASATRPALAQDVGDGSVIAILLVFLNALLDVQVLKGSSES
jgi:hypothetical protein